MNLDVGAMAYMVGRYNIQTMIDIGCGFGTQVKLAVSIGMEAYGIDGDWTLPRDFPLIIHDYCTGSPALPFKRGYDLAWSVEFVEHVERQYIANYMDTMKQAKRVVITHAVPDQGGHHHVNEQNEEYWTDLFTKNGFRILPHDTYMVRSLSTMRAPYMKRTGLVFENIGND
jgi:cyclopropane fatty-acyl-phospholipid synthase-like methyltransferase